ncbi:MAG TPA: hypothetical protein VJ453_04495, partial [Terriglobales bacterium]|nr:hypothetical protein [Terriglobales bacterium]
DAVNREAAKNNRPGVELKQVPDSEYYSIKSTDPRVPVGAYYTVSRGYLVAGPSVELVEQAISTRKSGDTLARSGNFQALFPSDRYVNVSGLIYQNLAPVITPIANQLSPSQLQSIQTLVSNTEPSLICAYGDESRIQFSSKSKTLGIDLKALTISALLDQVKPGTRNEVTP